MARPRVHFESAKAHLVEHGETGATELAAALGLTAGTLASAMRVPARDGEVVKRLDGRAVFYSMPDGTQPDPEAEAAEEVPFAFCIHSDGDVDLQGLIPLENGAVRMTKAMVYELKKFITWTPA